MSPTDKRFQGSIPAFYDQYMVPVFFEPYAEDLAARLTDLRQGLLIETAAGTGALTLALMNALPPGVRIVASDLNEEMVRVGMKRAQGPRVTWRQADAQALPFDDAAAEALVCQFGVMFFPHKDSAHREARRVLKPGGRYVFSVWDLLERNEVSDVVARAVASFFASAPPDFFARTPFGYSNQAVICEDLGRVGFDRVSIETVDRVSRIPSAQFAAVALCQGTPLRNEIEVRDGAALDAVIRTVQRALEERFGPGPFDHSMRAKVVTAMAT